MSFEKRDIALVSLFVIAASAFALHVGMYQIGGYDLSPLIDLQWRLHHGEVPGADFIYTFPLQIAFLLKVYGLLFAPSWVGLMWINVLLFAACVITVFIFWPTSFRPVEKYIALGLLAIPLLVTNHLWHSGSAQMLAVTYCVLLLSEASEGARPSLAREIVLCLTAGLFFFSKQNEGLPFELALCGWTVVHLAFFQSQWRRGVRLVAIHAIGIALAAALLRLTLGISFYTLISTFTAVAGRANVTTELIRNLPFGLRSIEAIVLCSGLVVLVTIALRRRVVALSAPYVALAAASIFWNLHHAYEDYLQTIVIVFLLTAMFSFGWDGRKPSLRLSLCLIACGLSLLPWMSDIDTKYNDAPFMLFALMGVADFAVAWVPLIFQALTVVLLLVCTADGLARDRMHDVGGRPHVFVEEGRLTAVPSGYFQGLHVGPHFFQFQHDVSAALQTYAPDHRGVFCGSHIELCYADNQLQSPRGLPLWWHPGSSFPMNMEDDVFRRFVQDNFQLLIFRRNESESGEPIMDRIPERILQYIGTHYQRINSYDSIVVYIPLAKPTRP